MLISPKPQPCGISYLGNKADIRRTIGLVRKCLQEYHIFSQVIPLFTHFGNVEVYVLWSDIWQDVQENFFRQVIYWRRFTGHYIQFGTHVLSPPIWEQYWCYLHLIIYGFRNIEAQVDTLSINSNLDVELLWKSELTVQCTNAFNTILPTPRSTKYSPFFSLQLQFLSLFHRAFQSCNVITWPKQTIPLTLETIQSCNFTNLPITSCT